MSTKPEQSLLADIPALKRLHKGQNDADTQAGDLQGLSWAETSDGESVAELVSEGQVFEAEAVIGFKEASDAPFREVRTRQVQENDVPLEYLDGDR